MPNSTKPETTGHRSFNINDYARVRLGTQAVAAYRARMEKFNASFPMYAQSIDPPVDKDGYFRDQLWSLMSLIGPLCGAGSCCVENCELILEFPDA